MVKLAEIKPGDRVKIKPGHERSGGQIATVKTLRMRGAEVYFQNPANLSFYRYEDLEKLDA